MRFTVILKNGLPGGGRVSVLVELASDLFKVKKALEDRTGEPVEVRGVISLPGWYVEDTKPLPSPAVKNPKLIPSWISAQEPPKRSTSPEQRRRITAFLKEKAEIDV